MDKEIVHNLLLDHTCDTCRIDCNNKETNTCSHWIPMDITAYVKKELIKTMGIPKEWLKFDSLDRFVK